MAEYRIEHFTKSFTIGGRRLEVLRGLDLSGDTGEITVIPVSYTHLDVYKRQASGFALTALSKVL